MPERDDITLRKADAPGAGEGWMVLSNGTPIGFIAGNEVHTPSGAAYTVREGRGAARFWSAEGKPVANFDREPDFHVKDVASGVMWKLKPDWMNLVESAPDGAKTLNVWDAFSEPYTLEEAQGVVPARVKLMLAWVMVR